MPNAATSAVAAVPQIELSNVAVRSVLLEDEAPAISGIDWRLHPGEFWAIGGVHDWEQSHLLRTMAGLESPLEGTARCFGFEINDGPEDTLRQKRLRIALVPPGGGRMFHGQTVAENVALPLRYHRNWSEAEAEDQVAALLDLTGLTPVARKSAGGLGRHWRQRVGLARALGVGPEVLLLDQPLARLDFGERDWCIEFLHRLRNGALPIPGIRPQSIVVTTESIAPWKSQAGNFAMVEKKRWRTLSDTAELSESP
ncbi:MAG: ATP-binding cassette domain-containing protein [Opitutaceae bacterium]|nr:ATP-binding cassette domain-containing protein [Verrucomicrobiales bacterium]